MSTSFQRAQAAYDAQTPPEYDAKCECGHSGEDHGDDNTPDIDAMREALEQIIQVGNAPADTSRHSKLTTMIHIAKRGLSICAWDDCECTKFSEADPDDDGDYAFDSARDARLE